MQQEVTEFASKARINLKKPFEELPRKSREVLLAGGNGFRGILAILDSLYRECVGRISRVADRLHVAAWSARPATASGCGRPAWRFG